MLAPSVGPQLEPAVQSVDVPRQVCTNLLTGQSFQHAKVYAWVQTIVENVLKELAVTNDDPAKTVNGKFKYIGEPPCRSCPAPPMNTVTHPRARSCRSHVPHPAKNGRGAQHVNMLLLGQGNRRCDCQLHSRFHA